MKFESAGEVIRALRTERGFTLRELADRLRWNRARLSKYENNRLGLSIGVIEEIASALECSPLELVFECLKHRYPNLSRTKAGKLVEQLVAEVSKPIK